MGVDVIDGTQLLAFVQRGKKRTGVGERHGGLPGEHVANGVPPARAGEVAQAHTLRLEKPLVFFSKQMGDFGDGLAPASHSHFVGPGGQTGARVDERTEGDDARCQQCFGVEFFHVFPLRIFEMGGWHSRSSPKAIW